jgi:hypothetical protein
MSKVVEHDRHIITAAARHAGTKAYQAGAAERRAKLAPIIQKLRAAGITNLSGLAAVLNARGVPTPAGRRHWYATSVAQLLKQLEG